VREMLSVRLAGVFVGHDGGHGVDWTGSKAF